MARGRGAALAADLPAEDVLHGRRGCPWLWFGFRLVAMTSWRSASGVLKAVV
jgi:hypothetical protein